MKQFGITLTLLLLVTSTYAQSPRLDSITHHYDSLSPINNTLTGGNLWTASSTNLGDPHGDYIWVNVPREEFVNDGRDKLLYHSGVPLFTTAIMYHTRDRNTLDPIKNSIVSHTHSDGNLVTSNLGRSDKFSDGEHIIEVFEALELDAQGVSKFVLWSITKPTIIKATDLDKDGLED